MQVFFSFKFFLNVLEFARILDSRGSDLRGFTMYTTSIVVGWQLFRLFKPLYQTAIRTFESLEFGVEPVQPTLTKLLGWLSVSQDLNLFLTKLILECMYNHRPSPVFQIRIFLITHIPYPEQLTWNLRLYFYIIVNNTFTNFSFNIILCDFSFICIQIIFTIYNFIFFVQTY